MKTDAIIFLRLRDSNKLWLILAKIRKDGINCWMKNPIGGESVIHCNAKDVKMIKDIINYVA